MTNIADKLNDLLEDREASSNINVDDVIDVICMCDMSMNEPNLIIADMKRYGGEINIERNINELTHLEEYRITIKGIEVEDDNPFDVRILMCCFDLDGYHDVVNNYCNDRPKSVVLDPHVAFANYYTVKNKTLHSVQQVFAWIYINNIKRNHDDYSVS